jgi:hypothetical protein
MLALDRARTALGASRGVGGFGIFTHPLDEKAHSFYARWGFQERPFDPRRAVVVCVVDPEQSGLVW